MPSRRRRAFRNKQSFTVALEALEARNLLAGDVFAGFVGSEPVALAAAGDLASIHGKKFEDLNANGQLDSQEIVIIGGVPDGFSTANAELTNPNSQAVASVGQPNPRTEYDGTLTNHFFLETLTFAKPALPIKSAFLEIHMKPLGGIVSNDSLNLFAGDDWDNGAVARDGFSITALAQTDWNPANFPNGHTFTIPIENALSDLELNQQLHVYVEDDTSIDYVELHLLTEEPCLPDWPIEVTGTDSSGNEVTIATTTMHDDPATAEDETGMYWIQDLPSGVYTVSEGDLPGWDQTYPQDVAIDGHTLVDDFYQPFVGSADGSALTALAPPSSGPASGTASYGATTSEDYLYFSAWSNDSGAQGLLTSATLSNHNLPMLGGSSRWEVTSTGTDIDDLASAPSLSTVASAIGNATANSTWTDVAVGPVNTDAIRDCNGTWLTGTYPLIEANANWMWHDTGQQESPCANVAPFADGFDHGEFLVFRYPTAAGKHVITIGPGETIEGVDFGNTAVGSIHGKKFEDLNANGQLDSEDIVITGGVPDGFSTANVESANPNPITVTSVGQPNPRADYDGTVADHFFLETLTFTTPSLPIKSAFLEIHMKPLGGVVSNDSINLFADNDWDAGAVDRDGFSITSLAGQAWNTANFPNGHTFNIPIENALPDLKALEQLHIYVEDDTSIDYIKLHLQTQEPCLPDWPIEVTGVDMNGNSVSVSTTTMQDDPDTPEDETGMYWIDDLRPGTYTVSEGIRPGWIQSAPDSITHEVIIEGGDVYTDIDFGNYRSSSIHGQKWYDIDGDGERDDNEPGLDGWVIEVVDPLTGEVIATQETHSADLNGDGAIDPFTEKGLYWIDGVPVGKFQVREVAKDGWMQTSPNPSAEINGLAMADNHFQAWVGVDTGLTAVGPVVSGPQLNGLSIINGTPTAPATGFQTTEEFLYLSAWSDDAVAQGLLVDIEIDGVQMLSGGDMWQVLPTGSDYDQAAPPFTAVINDIGASIPSDWQSVAAGPMNSAGLYGVFGQIAGIDPAAEWMWHDNGQQTSPTAPFVVGFDHDEYLIFRIPTGAGVHSINVEPGHVYDGFDFGNKGTGGIHGNKFVVEEVQEHFCGESVVDQFAAPTEASFQRPGLAAFLASVGLPSKDFDSTASNRSVGCSFEDLPDSIVAATIEVGVAPLGFSGPSSSNNDNLALEMYSSAGVVLDSWSAYFDNPATTPDKSIFPPAGGWGWVTTNYGYETIGLDLGNLPSGYGSASLINSLNTHKFLDLRVDDDTNVDYARLEVSIGSGADGWTIEALDSNGNIVATTTTMSDDLSTPEDETGMYWFNNLPPGTYTIREIQRNGWNLASPTTNTHTITIGPGEVVEDVNFVNEELGSIHGQTTQQVYKRGHCQLGTADNYAPGTDPVNPSAGVTNYLTQNGLVAKPYDDPTHDRYFADSCEGLPDGITHVSVRTHLKPSASFLTRNDTFGIGSFDPSWAGAGSPWLGDGTVDYAASYHLGSYGGNWPNTYASHVGQTWDEATFPNGDLLTFSYGPSSAIVAGLNDPANLTNALDFIMQDDTMVDYIEICYDYTVDVGLNGVTVQVMDASNNMVGSTVTHSMDLDGDGAVNPETESGLYWIEDLVPGTHTVKEILPNGTGLPTWVPVSPSSGAQTATVQPGQSVQNVDFANRPFARRWLGPCWFDILDTAADPTGITSATIDFTGLSGVIPSDHFAETLGVTFENNAGPGVVQEGAESGFQLEGYDGGYRPEGDSVFVTRRLDDDPLGIVFDEPVATFTSFVATGDDGASGIVRVNVFDADDNLITTTPVHLGHNGDTTTRQGFIQVHIEQDAIKRVTIQHEDDSDFGAVCCRNSGIVLDDIAWTRAVDYTEHLSTSATEFDAYFEDRQAPIASIRFADPPPFDGDWSDYLQDRGVKDISSVHRSGDRKQLMDEVSRLPEGGPDVGPIDGYDGSYQPEGQLVAWLPSYFELFPDAAVKRSLGLDADTDGDGLNDGEDSLGIEIAFLTPVTSVGAFLMARGIGDDEEGDIRGIDDEDEADVRISLCPCPAPAIVQFYDSDDVLIGETQVDAESYLDGNASEGFFVWKPDGPGATIARMRITPVDENGQFDPSVALGLDNLTFTKTTDGPVFTPTDIFVSGSNWGTGGGVSPYQVTNNLTHSGTSGHHGRTLSWVNLDTITVAYTGAEPTAEDLTLSDPSLTTTFMGASGGVAAWRVADPANPLAFVVEGVTNQIGPKDDLVIDAGSTLSVTVDLVPGDLNGSATTDIGDIIGWVSFLGAATFDSAPLSSDVDGSGLTDVGDVRAIIFANGAAATPPAAALDVDQSVDTENQLARRLSRFRWRVSPDLESRIPASRDDGDLPTFGRHRRLDATTQRRSMFERKSRHDEGNHYSLAADAAFAESDEHFGGEPDRN